MKKRSLTKKNINSNLLINISSSIIIKGGALIVSFLTVPAYLNYFDNQQILGVWFTLLSILTWILTFDMGIGNGLRNNLVKALVKNDYLLAKKYISSAYIFIGLISLFLIVIVSLFYKYIDWQKIFNVSTLDISSNTLSLTILIVFISIILQFFLRIINSILFAMQKSAMTNVLTLLTSTIILFYVLYFKSTDSSINLINLSIVYLFAVNVPLLLATILTFMTTLKTAKPNMKYFEKGIAKRIFMLGGVFFWIQLMFMFITTTNEFLITWLLEPAMVVDYQIYNKLFTFVGTIFAIGLTPIWSAVTMAITEKNFIWVKKLFRILKLAALIAISIEFIFIIFLQQILNYWLGENTIIVNYWYAVIFAVSGSIFIWNGVISSIANGIGKLKVQVVWLTFGALLKIPIAIMLVNLYDSWIGIILANILAMSIYCVIQPFSIKKYINKKIKGDLKNV